MIVLGIDPGFAIVGYGLLQVGKNQYTTMSSGVIRTKPDMPLESRLFEIYHDLETLIARFKPDCMAVEQLFFHTNQKTVMQVAQARGVIVFAARENNIPVFEYTPLQVKQAVVGYGRAEKKQVMEMTRQLLKLNALPKPDDAADALAIALCHAESSQSLLFGQK